MEQDVDFKDIEFGTPTERLDLIRPPSRRGRPALIDLFKHPADRVFRRELYETDGRPTFLYIVCCKGFAKVGIASDVKSRVASMQAGCPFEIRLLERYCLSKADALQAEIKVFQALRQHHARGEWFQCSAATVRYAALQAVRDCQPVAVPPGLRSFGSRGTRFVWVTPAGEFGTAAAAAKHYGLSKQAIVNRIARKKPGWLRKLRR